MRSCSTALSGLLCVALLSTTAAEALAFCRTTTCSKNCKTDEYGCNRSGEFLFWATKCVGFSVAQGGTKMLAFSAVEKVVDRSFQNWSALPCEEGGNASITFSRLDNVRCGEVAYDPDGPNANVVFFRDDSWDYKGTDNNLAYTVVTFDTATGQIFDADIVVNTAMNLYTTSDTNVQYDLESVLTHEVGHVLGIAHSSHLESGSTMSSTYSQGDISPRTLSSDDTQAACAAYPPDRGATCLPTPTGGFTADCVSQNKTATKDSGCSLAGNRNSHAPLPWSLLGLLGAGIASRLVRRDKRR